MRSSRLLVLLFACMLFGCFNRAPVRFHGASSRFPEASTGYVSTHPLRRTLRIATPADARAAHYRERVADTRWTGCKTDPFEGAAPRVLASEIAHEVRETQIFEQVVEVSLHFTLRDGEQVVYERTLEKVVTDADEEYSGSQVTFIEQAMKVTLSDSLRTLLYKLVWDLDRLEALHPKPL